MNTEILKSILLILVQIFSICLASYYLGMELLVFALIIKNQAIKAFRKVRREPQLEEQGEEKWSLQNLYKKSLFFNHTLAILTISFIALIISQFSILSSFVKLEIFTIVVSILPYIFSFKRATNVGINGGIIGTIIGLIIFSLNDPGLNWWQNAGYFLVITGLANVSGWIGGWVGPGQLKEAFSVSVFNIRMNHEEATLSSLEKTICLAVDDIVPRKSKRNHFDDLLPRMVITQGTNSFSIVSFKHELEWKQSISPQRIALGWLFDKNIYSSNIIIDYVFNLFRYKVTKIILVSRQLNKEKTEKSREKIYLIVLNYKETPSIVWIDDEVNKLASEISLKIKQALIGDEEISSEAEWVASQPIETIVRQWLPQITLEQYSKNTIGANLPYDVISQKRIKQEVEIQPEIMEEIIALPTAFNRFRGKAFAFVSFMFFQVFIGILVNILSTKMVP